MHRILRTPSQCAYRLWDNWCPFNVSHQFHQWRPTINGLSVVHISILHRSFKWKVPDICGWKLILTTTIEEAMWSNQSSFYIHIWMHFKSFFFISNLIDICYFVEHLFLNLSNQIFLNYFQFSTKQSMGVCIS